LEAYFRSEASSILKEPVYLPTYLCIECLLAALQIAVSANSVAPRSKTLRTSIFHKKVFISPFQIECAQHTLIKFSSPGVSFLSEAALKALSAFNSHLGLDYF
jgi:hypothetical protein